MSECGWIEPGDHGGLPAPTCRRDAGHSGMHHADPDIDSGVPASMHGGRGARSIHVPRILVHNVLREAHRNSRVKFVGKWLKTPAGGHVEDADAGSAPEHEAATVPPAGRCPIHRWARVVQTDPTGGDPFMGGPVLIAVCSKCGRQV